MRSIVSIMHVFTFSYMAMIVKKESYVDILMDLQVLSPLNMTK
jgi:hypothetical protein